MPIQEGSSGYKFLEFLRWSKDGSKGDVAEFDAMITDRGYGLFGETRKSVAKLPKEGLDTLIAMIERGEVKTLTAHEVAVIRTAHEQYSLQVEPARVSEEGLNMTEGPGN